MSQNTPNILVGIDFSESSNVALLHARKLAVRMQARLHLCHFVQGQRIASQDDLGLNIPEDFPEAKEARADLQRILADLGSDIDGQIHLRLGEPKRGFLAMIQELKPDLVVVCSHGYGLIKRTLLGSVTRHLVEKSPVPVVVVPTPGREAILNAPEPLKEPELPAVGRAVIDSSVELDLNGIGGIGGGGVVLK